ncbi:MAG TPA: DUF3667 domain-containing protein [Flavitalea sp.]|nr:DUF3667 domain-containing protein [Flavitalea sp.]
MSHSKEKKANVCLNCETKLVGDFCHTCGQEDTDLHDSFWHLCYHFFHDMTHIEAKWFNTMKYLIIRPGFLSKEYLRGRRVNYLHPIRMYVITSAFFFILFFTFFHSGNSAAGKIGHQEQHIADSLYGNWHSAREFALKNANSKEDTLEVEKALKMISQSALGEIVDSLDKTTMRSPIINLVYTGYATKDDYIRDQKRLPLKERDSWIERMITYRKIDVSQKIDADPDGFFDFSYNNLVHKIPQLLFVSLPLFALLLKFLYWRQNVYYSQHAIFSLHLYVFTFISLLFYFTFSKLQDVYHWGWLRYALAVCILYMIVYTFMAMKSFYKQGFFKTLGKYFLLNLMSLTVMFLLFVAFFIFSVFHS